MSFKQKIIFGGVTVLLICSLVFCLKSTWCGIKSNDMGLSSKYTMVSGCLVSENEKVWVAPDKFRNIVD